MVLTIDSNQTNSDKGPLLAQINTQLPWEDRTLDRITAVRVSLNPAQPFSQTRQLVTVANAFAFALDLKVNGKNFEKPIYQREPNITSG